MALVKIYAKSEKRDDLFKHVSYSVKNIVAAALNVPSLPTKTSGIETVYVEGIDLVEIDYILEVVAVERPEQQVIAQNIIDGLVKIYPQVKFSVYFNNISEKGMASTPRPPLDGEYLTEDQAIARSKHEI